MRCFDLKLVLLLLAALALTACGAGSNYVAIGPQFGYTWSRITSSSGGSYGIEASGGSFPFAKASAGWVKRRRVEPPFREEDLEREDVVYLAWEPWFLVGGTLGAAWSDDGGVGLAAGVWEGIYIPTGALTTTEADPGLVPEFSLSIGLRILGRGTELYVSPKVSFRPRGGELDGGFFGASSQE